LPLLKEMSGFLDEVANIRPNPRLPWVGAAAFSHKGGTHVNAVQKLLRSYEHIDPSLVGNSRQVLISELAGRSNIIMKARELGFDVTKDTPQLTKMLQTMRLSDYKVRIVDSSVGTAARTRVLIESTDGTSAWTTIGVNENIIEASLQALVDSLEYGLIKKEIGNLVSS